MNFLLKKQYFVKLIFHLNHAFNSSEMFKWQKLPDTCILEFVSANLFIYHIFGSNSHCSTILFLWSLCLIIQLRIWPNCLLVLYNQFNFFYLFSPLVVNDKNFLIPDLVSDIFSLFIMVLFPIHFCFNQNTIFLWSLCMFWISIKFSLKLSLSCVIIVNSSPPFGCKYKSLIWYLIESTFCLKWLSFL